MVFKNFLLFCCVMVITRCENHGRRAIGRKPRFISFDTDKNDVQVSLDFTVPFLSIPIKQSGHSAFGFPGLALPQIILNPSALAFGGFIILASSVLLPLFSKGFGSYNMDMDRYYRVLDSDNESSNILMDLGGQLMSMSHGCPLRVACWMSQSATDPESRRTVEKIIRNKLVLSMLNTTSIDEAITNGRNGLDCSTYQPCPIREKHLHAMMKSFGVLPPSKSYA